MSGESPQLERSTLERKDRDELFTIATAMGGKPNSRTRKAAIIDMIFELAGIPVEGAAGSDDGASPDIESTGQTGSATGSDADPDTDDDNDAGAGVGSDDGPVSDVDPGGDPLDGSDDEDADEGTDPSGGDARSASDAGSAGARSDNTRNKRSSGGADRRGDGSRRDGARSGDTAGGEAREDGEGSQQAQSQDEPDFGNRRRRRRGRERQGDRPQEQWEGEPVEVEGVLDLREEGYGFLRLHGYLPSRDDVYVSVKQARQFSLRRGDRLKGTSRPASRNEKNPALLRIDEVNGAEPSKAAERPHFESLTPLFPDERLRMEIPGEPTNMTARIMDLVSPIGKGQRGLIVSPPKAGKTTVMKKIARSIETNHPEVQLIVALIDERPEEVTDMRRSVKGEVVASTFDRPAEEHTAVVELTIERAKRMVEEGRDVVVILDGITRLARAYNLAAPPTGRIMSGGLDVGALYPPKKIFGAARNTEEAGSLTILATALVETGSKMDEVIFEEFKGTGNMELKLDRRLAQRRVYPAIDVDASSTRHEELLFDRKSLQASWKLRRVLSGMGAEGGSGAGLEMLIERLGTFRTNDEFLAEVAKTPGADG